MITALRAAGLVSEGTPILAASTAFVTLRASAAQSPEHANLIKRIMATASRLGVELSLDEPVSLAKVDRELRANAEAGGAAKDTAARMRFKHDLFMAGVIPA